MELTFNDSYFSTRRSIRAYAPDKEIDPELIRSLLSKAAHAPNTGNMQLYSVILTTSPDEIKAIAPAHFSQPAITGAKAVLTFCLDLNRYHKWCVDGGAEPGLNNLQGYTWAVMDTAIFAQQFVTLAELNGLGTCYLGTTTYNAPMIAEQLRLPHGVVPLLTVTLGYPAENPEIPERLDLDCILHGGHYHDFSDSDIKRLYAEKESMESYRKFVEENGKENLAQVYADVRYPRAANEHFSVVLKEFLKNQGIEM
ncbi:MAG: nitroreductase family protein [Paenibacillus sp.]|nr:nitroreductase family protein [Paenibacillus sp.]